MKLLESVLRAAVLDKSMPIEKRPLKIEDIAKPEPGKGQVLLKIEACGICRSNLHMIEGEWLKLGVPSKLPIIPGHEIVGRIQKVNDGDNSSQLKVGERVGVQPLFSTCGVCDYCVEGREELCSNKKSTGETVDGGYAEYMIADSSHVYPLPKNLKSIEAAPLFCPGVTAYSAVKKADLNPSDRVAVAGVGGVGQMVVQFASLYGAEVIAIDNLDSHLEASEKLGASLSINSGKDGDIAQELSRLGGVDKAFVFVPNTRVASQVIKGTRAGGSIVLGAFAGIDEFPFPEEKTVIGSVIGSRELMREVLKIAASGRIKMLTETHNLDSANETLKDLKDGDVVSRAVLVP